MLNQNSRKLWRARRVVSIAAALTLALIIGGVFTAKQFGQTRACPPPSNHPEWSVARRWDEALLDAVRRALPAPTVHARNLFHVSAAMWDAWATYDPDAAGYFLIKSTPPGLMLWLPATRPSAMPPIAC